MKLLLVYLAILFFAYPVSAFAAIELMNNGFAAPFLQSWVGVWVFAVAGGASAGFVRVDEIDNKLYAPFFAKIFIGTFAGVSLCALIATGSEPPAPALTFWAYAASFCTAPICAGLLVFISDQRRLNSIFNRASNMAQDRYLPPSKHEPTNKDYNND